MKLVMTLLVRDEEDIVDSTVKFHLDRGVDLVLVTDNLSLDRTRDLLRDFERQGVVHTWSEPNDEYRQWEWVSRMAQAAASDYGADWVLHCDADEFWWTDRPLPEVLEAIPPGHDVVTAPRHDFLPLEGDQPFFERMIVRDTRSRNILGRPLTGKCAHRAADDVIIAQGNHSVVNEGMVQAPEPLDAVIMHFPARTYAQFERKVVLGGRAYARNRDLPATVGNTWRVLYRAYLDGLLPSYFDRLVPDEVTLAEGLASGRYAVDTRLRDVLVRHPRPQTRLEMVALRAGDDDHVGNGSAVRAAAVAAAASCRNHPSARTVASNVEEWLVDFIDGARRSVDVLASGLSACAVLAALASAHQRGVALRLLTDDPLPARRWALQRFVRPVPPGPYEAVVVRDSSDVWSGPTSLDAHSLHDAEPIARILPDRTSAATLERHVDAVWALASAARPRNAEPAVVEGWS